MYLQRVATLSRSSVHVIWRNSISPTLGHSAVSEVSRRTMSCSNCDALRKEMEKMKDNFQLMEFELVEKLNYSEDKVEWSNQDLENVKGELEEVKQDRDRYKALVESLGIDANTVKLAEANAPAGKNVPRLLEIIKKQSELLDEMKSLLVSDTLSK